MNTPAEPFEGFPKVPRLMRDVTITEKIDGTNGLVYIELVNPKVADAYALEGTTLVEMSDGVVMAVYAGSRRRWITPERDNYGFARWVDENAETLARDLGPGRHFGEWWGLGIQRRYNQEVKRFSLFNTRRGGPYRDKDGGVRTFDTPNLDLVPVLYEGPLMDGCDFFAPSVVLGELEENGSEAALGFMNPEGIMVYHQRAGQMFKYTLGGDGEKGEDHPTRGRQKEPAI